MEQVWQEILARAPEIAQWGVTVVCYFFVFLYKKKISNTSSILTLSVKDVVDKVAKAKGELTSTQETLEARIAKCEEVLRIYTEGGNDDAGICT